MQREKIIQLETVVDHLSGEEIGMALCALNDDPMILDAIYLPGIGKKNRPAGLFQVLCHPGNEEKAAAAIFRHTHTLGVRISMIERFVLPRSATTANVCGHKIRAKSYEVDGCACLRPEADEIAAVAANLGVGAPALRLKASHTRD